MKFESDVNLSSNIGGGSGSGDCGSGIVDGYLLFMITLAIDLNLMKINIFVDNRVYDIRDIIGGW